MTSTRVEAFFRGLGLDESTLSEAELEATGRLVRVLALGLMDLHASTVGTREDANRRDSNPLKGSWPAETRLRYIFGGRLAAAGLPPPERAVRELLAELVTHNAATANAMRLAIEGVLKDFAPDALQSRLQAGEAAAAWEAFRRDFELRSHDLQAWSRELLNSHFGEAYLRESLRIRRETPGR